MFDGDSALPSRSQNKNLDFFLFKKRMGMMSSSKEEDKAHGNHVNEGWSFLRWDPQGP